MSAEETTALLRDQTQVYAEGWAERLIVQSRRLYGRRRQDAFCQSSSEDESAEIHRDAQQRPCKASSVEKLTTDLFYITESDCGRPDPLAGDFEPNRRSVSLSLVFSSLYAVVLFQLYLYVSWWIAFREGNSIKAWLTLTIAHASSVPLYAVAVCSVAGRRTDSCCIAVAKALTFTLVSPFFNIVPLLQLVLRLKDSAQMYRTSGRVGESARLKPTDIAVFSNLMWFVTLSCVPQTVFQISEVLKLHLQEQQWHSDVLRKLFIACISILLTSYSCVQFSNLKENSSPRVSKRALEHLSWLLLLTARVLPCSTVLTKTPHLGYIFFIIFLLHAFLYIFYKVSCRENVFCSPLCVVTQAAVSMFFLRGGSTDNQRMWRLIAFLALQEAENVVFILVPFWDDELPVCDIATYYSGVLCIALCVHFGAFVAGSLGLALACHLKHPGTCIEV